MPNYGCGRWSQLGKRAVILGQLEKSTIAKPAAGRRGRVIWWQFASNLSVAVAATRHTNGTRRICQCQVAHEPSRTPPDQHGGQFGKELGAILSWRGVVAGVTRREHARRSAECGNF